MIKPTAYHYKLDGKSEAHLMHFNDGNEYAVKFFQPEFEKSLPNEWIGYCLARFLQLPVPFGRIVDISNEHLFNQGQQNMTRYQFASMYVPGCVNGHEVSNVTSLRNANAMAAIILFDYWVGNQDRTLKNILFQAHTQGEYTLWAIDHAEIFGGNNWSVSDLETLPKGLIKSSAHKKMAEFIESEKEFYHQLNMIQKIPILLLEEIVDLLPPEWGVTNEEKKAVVTTLLERRRKVLPRLTRQFIKTIYRPIKNKKR